MEDNLRIAVHIIYSSAPGVNEKQAGFSGFSKAPHGAARVSEFTPQCQRNSNVIAGLNHIEASRKTVTICYSRSIIELFNI
jgi:hypothetical protein